MRVQANGKKSDYWANQNVVARRRQMKAHPNHRFGLAARPIRMPLMTRNRLKSVWKAVQTTSNGTAHSSKQLNNRHQLPTVSSISNINNSDYLPRKMAWCTRPAVALFPHFLMLMGSPHRLIFSIRRRPFPAICSCNMPHSISRSSSCDLHCHRSQCRSRSHHRPLSRRAVLTSLISSLSRDFFPPYVCLLCTSSCF